MGLRRRECRASMASVSKTRSFEVWGGREEEDPAEQVFWGGRAPQGGTENNSPECCHAASARRALVRTGAQTWHGPQIWGWRESQGNHLKCGQRPSGGGHILLLSEQPQEDVFFILRPAVDVSVLKPGGYMLLGEREWQKQKPLEKNPDSRSQIQFPIFPSWASPTKFFWELYCFAFGRGSSVKWLWVQAV